MEEMCELEITKRVMEKTIYFGSVLGTSLFLIWIAWMPLLQVSLVLCRWSLLCVVMNGN
jgi:hypothetical protein